MRATFTKRTKNLDPGIISFAMDVDIIEIAPVPHRPSPKQSHFVDEPTIQEQEKATSALAKPPPRLRKANICCNKSSTFISLNFRQKWRFLVTTNFRTQQRLGGLLSLCLGLFVFCGSSPVMIGRRGGYCSHGINARRNWLHLDDVA